MSDISNNDTIEMSEKPVQENEDVKFPPFPDPTDNDFEDDIPEEERTYYKNKFKDLNTVTSVRLHCSACDRHLGCSARNESRMRPHPLLRTLVCHTCHTFYNSGEFEKGDDGSELYCRWCGQGGQVYCCSGCPHVFCAKCIRRNLGNPKIKEIEELDDWKCFKCNNRCLWDLRAICWAVLRYCDLKNKITYETQDLALKETYQKHCLLDHSECCKNKFRKKESKRKEPESTPSTRKSSAAALISKIPPTIQVKKFASINMEESVNIKSEKKAQKRPASPKHKAILIKNPIAISTKMANQMIPVPKKIRMPISPVINPVRFSNDRKTPHTYSNFTRIRPKPPQMSIMFNGFNNTATYSNDNINLSLENLTQGLDMSAVAAIAGSSNDDDVVCTPDFPLEPLCEVTEDNGDDDVQCMTPGPAFTPKPPPPLVARNNNTLPDLSPENIVQMTENDVTVNTTTGGLKFRVDPQTLSSNKMYRLPDGRIFAINANPTMPGGYSATIVALTDNNSGKATSKGTTFAAKLSAVTAQGATPPPLKYVSRNQTSRSPNKRSTPKSTKVGKGTDSSRICDLNVPIEWYRYNLIDAIDALEYSLSRLHHLKKNATTMHLRTRSINEMRNLHKSLERSLTTSMTRFKEVRDNLNKEFKQYISKKMSNNLSDDDDVEILHEDDNDDPIFIDENSLESNAHDNQEVDLTAVGSSDLNDSSERSSEKNDLSRIEADTSNTEHHDNNFVKINMSAQILANKQNDHEHLEKQNVHINLEQNTDEKDDSSENQNEQDIENKNKTSNENFQLDCKELINNIVCKTETSISRIKKIEMLDEDKILNESLIPPENDKKIQDAEISEEMIENLLKDDNAGDDDTQNIQSLNTSDEIKDVLSKKD
ncbi:uncharacterized protein LOC126768112 [Nymphalis io]|uniref:uncharacterized protein LOC126768112 n=1 Tax=Inachis io TaxID=171585 RepID=UPI0021680FDD|nr:uncharacterized protein LOC126768112 [Nymphalis io]